MSPDWADKPEEVPYSVLADPQSLNLYSYVRNHPVNQVDADGHQEAIPIPWPEIQLGPLPVGGDPAKRMQDQAKQDHEDYEAEKFIKNAAANPPAPTIPTGVAGEIPVGSTPAAPVGAMPAPSVSTGTTSATGTAGTIYVVPGASTASGKPYVGRHNKPDPARTRRSNDGRDRSKAVVVDHYDPSNVQDGRQKEQAQIDAHGGKDQLDNKRDEIKK